MWCRSFPTSSLSLSGLLVAGTGAFPWLVTVLTSTHLLLAASADSPGALGVLPYFPPVGVMLCAHLQLGRGFLMLPACPSPSFGLWVYWFIWLLFSTRVPYLRDGVEDCLSSIGTKVWSLLCGQVHWSVPGWTSRLCLRVSARPVPQGVLPGGPRCVLTLRFTLAHSRVL